MVAGPRATAAGIEGDLCAHAWGVPPDFEVFFCWVVGRLWHTVPPQQTCVGCHGTTKTPSRIHYRAGDEVTSYPCRSISHQCCSATFIFQASFAFNWPLAISQYMERSSSSFTLRGVSATRPYGPTTERGYYFYSSLEELRPMRTTGQLWRASVASTLTLSSVHSVTLSCQK